MAEGLYVYCVIGTGEARNFGPFGIGGRGDIVTTLSYRDLSAVVSSIPMDKYVVGRDALLSHEKVLEKVMAEYPLLPVRFYTIAPNAEEVRSLLRTRYNELKQLLRQLDGKVELGLKAIWRDMNEVFKRVAEAVPEERRLGVAGAAGLRQGLEEKKAQMRQLLLAALKSAAVDFRLNKTYGDDMVMNAAFLVDRRREKEFDALVAQVGASLAKTIELKYVGPVPPYSFVNIVIRGDLGLAEMGAKER
ncbi:MAG: GvpL/GvpF family gas vesicle protein [Chloroflexi bacterium]|nr:GvpL/GvpF family gas vesicle protein [Chloroflexota bacterium]